MVTTRHEPADTRSMGIVHSALRRDLERTRMVLTDHPHPDSGWRRQELEMMPVVAATRTDAEYRAVEHEHFVATKGLRELGAEAHRVVDGLPLEDRRVMLSVVPALPGFVLLHGFGRSYRRAAARRWGTGVVARVPSLQLSMATEGS